MDLTEKVDTSIISSSEKNDQNPTKTTSETDAAMKIFLYGISEGSALAFLSLLSLFKGSSC